MMNLDHIPLFDHHCHSLRRSGAPLNGVAFRRHFSESSDPAMAEHLPSALFYGRGLRDLATLLGCEPTEEAVLAARHALPLEQYARRLFEAANISQMAIDTGLRGAENYTLDEQRDFLPCALHEVIRLETLTEQLIADTASFAQLEEAFRAALNDVRGSGVVGFKSIAAYRGGLQIEPRTRAEAATAYPALKELARRYGRVRLSDRPMLEYMLRVGLELAAAQELPVQFHTGLGDDDVDLRTGNPLHMRALFQDEALRGVRFVLLHTWPYMREAGYLAGIYGHVFVDLSLTIPFAAHGGVPAILAALEQAPTSKVLLSTDAFSIPEIFYLGALYARESLAKALDALHIDGWMTIQQTEHAAHQMLYDNAAHIYGVG